MLKSWPSAVCCAALGLAVFNGVTVADEWDAKVDEIMATFTNTDLAGQMTQIPAYGLVNSTYQLDEDKLRSYAKYHVGSYLSPPMSAFGEIDGRWGWTTAEMRDFVGRIQTIVMEENGGHPMIYGTDAAHGNALMIDTVYFGQQINAAATFNPDLVYDQGRITARDTLASGISWIFDPVLDNMHNPLWPRVYETFGEDPYLTSVMGAAITRGIQSYNESAACMKHWIGYGWTPTGHDKDGVTMSDFDMLNTYFPPYKAAVDAGLLSGMENYISVNGVPMVENNKYLKKLLRDDLQFEGLMVTDYAEINHLPDFHKTARNINEAVKFSLERTSIDMSMVPADMSSSASSLLTSSSSTMSFFNETLALLEDDPEIVDRIKESVRRIIKTKLKLGLYDNPLPGEEYLSLVGNDDDVASALASARESIVLLQNNDSTLPLSKDASVFLTGHSAHNIGYQCGGWTQAGTGLSGNDMFAHGVSVKQGLEKVAGNSSFTYFNGLNVTGEYTDEDLATAKEYASKADYTIAVIGESSYEEKTGDIDDLTLPLGQIEYVKALAATGTKVILVLFEGRPRILNDLPENVYAVINGMLACEQGGRAVADIIYGDVNPSGRMPITYPKYTGNVMIPYRHRVSTECASGDYCVPQWDFGHGLSYTNFTYSDMSISTTNVTSSSDSVNVSVTVTNSGSVTGKETVMLFLTQPYRSISVPEVKNLKKFSKISLDAGASQTVEFELTAADWSVYFPQIGQGLKLVAEDADYVVAIKPETDCDVYNETASSPLCATFTLSTGEYPFGSLVAERKQRGTSLATKRREHTAGDERKTKRMKSDLLLTTAEIFEKRLRGVFSFRAAIPVLDEYMSSIQIDDDDPGFLFNWRPINVNAFVTAANGLNPAQAPQWLRTPPPHITTESFIDDVIDRLRPVAGDQVAWVLLAPNTPEQFAAIHVRLAMLQAHDFMQAAAQAAFPVVNIGAQYLATTYLLTDTKAQRARPNRLEAIAPNGQPLRQLFF